jgi:hypothetical protein
MYISVANNKIIGVNAVSYSEQGVDYPITNIEVSDEVYNSYIADNDRYIYKDGAIIENPDYEEIKRQREQERINNLTMTAQDLLDLIANNGASFEEIDSFLNANKEFKLRLTTCQNVFCGVLRQFLPLSIGKVTLTDEMVVRAFKLKNDESPDV